MLATFKQRWNRGFTARIGVLAIGLLLAGCKKPPLSSEGKAIFALGRPAEKTALQAYGDATCAVRKDGARYCWGQDLQYLSPQKFPREVQSIGLGGSHYCILKDGKVSCIGRNLSGELGDGSTTKRDELTSVMHMSEVTQLGAASFKTCSIATSGEKRDLVFCWGQDEGRGTNGLGAPSPMPRRVGTIEDARELAVEDTFACVRRANGTVWCWGADTYGELGRGDEGMPWTNKQRPPTSEPVRVVHVDDAVGIAAGAFFGCVLTARGTVGCWGENSYGDLGDGTTRSRTYPSDVVGLSDVAQIAVGTFGHACARGRDGTVSCWGYDVGRPNGGSRTTPQPIPGLTDAVDIAAGHTHMCARRQNGAVVCWGDNTRFQLGVASVENSIKPIQVLEPE